MNDRLIEIARRLILAEKHISRIDTLYPASMFHKRESIIIPLELPSLPSIPKLPAQISKPLIQPQPARAQQIQAPQIPALNLGKLNPLIADKSIVAIECLGAGTNLRVKREIMTDTSIQLTENEILGIINIFAVSAKVPLAPVMKIDFGNLTLNAFVIPAIGSRFFIVRRS